MLALCTAADDVISNLNGDCFGGGNFVAMMVAIVLRKSGGSSRD